MKVYIFSEVKYKDNKHINQYLFDYLLDNNFDCVFIERVTMRLPSLSRIMKLKLPSLFNKREGVENSKIINCTILPPLKIFEKINKNRIKKIINNDANSIIITFVPHPHLFKEEYKKFIYYCVHDSSKQNFNPSTIDFEKKISKKKNSLIFCDNSDVLLNLSNEFSKYPLDDKNHSSFLMPPPVPDTFFEVRKTQKIYDFCYYGSFHKDIDINAILSLSKKYKILIISNNIPRVLLKKNNIIIHKSIYDMSLLAKKISTAKSILLPYKNSNFMDTITPAKVLQVIALKIPVFCTNNKIAKQYNFASNLDELHEFKICNLDYIFSVTKICSFIANKIENSHSS